MKKKFLANGWAYVFICCLSILTVITSIVVLIITKDTLDLTSYIYCIFLLSIIDIIFIFLCIYLYFTVKIDVESVKVYHLFKCIKEFKWSDIKCVEVTRKLYKYIFVTTDNRVLDEKLNSLPIKDPRLMRFIYSNKVIKVIGKFYKGQIIYS